MSDIQRVVKLIEDPFNGPYEGEDFSLNENGFIEVPVDNVKLAAIITRRVNQSGKFNQKLVKIGQKGDCILLDFDHLTDANPIHVDNIGFDRKTLAEIKQDDQGICYVYINGRRSNKTFKSVAVAKSFISKTDKILKQTADSLMNNNEDVDIYAD